ncbi:Na+/H+ antiporter NhaA [Gemmatirosa kalamazoonensis]|uniref:Na+/H+ antiporter NhaA n=1 Tax=Gemmatirosa kalamazoonensis TaxID=861299 RepID=UPI0004ACC272|nr:Na+/H+ antiporter NhaA [Gemmatirosa kalamazoonensis]
MTTSSRDTPVERAAPLAERLLAPLARFAGSASGGGVVLLAVTAVALAWANSPWAGAYHHLWETPIALTLGTHTFRATLHYLINDGLMAVFFFVVGLEIKREVLAGELATLRTAALPMIAALGGMVVPAALYTLVAHGTPAAAGWGVPMATDIAFALGALALIGRGLPTGLRVFLAALAVVDDLGAVLVIAVFYSGGVSWGALASAAAILVAALACNRAGVRRPWAYGALGITLWCAMIASGVHATIAGVLLALTIPARTRVDEPVFLAGARRALDDFDAAAMVTAADPDTTVLSNTAHHAAIEELETLCDHAQPPLVRIEHALHGPVTFGVMPIFALSNAGVSLDAAALGAAVASPAAIGAALGLVVGKPLGITLFSWLAVRARVAALPAGVTWGALTGVGFLGGIGFTMALFIAALAFPDSPLLEAAKTGVLVASLGAGVTGVVLLRRRSGVGA